MNVVGASPRMDNSVARLLERDIPEQQLPKIGKDDFKDVDKEAKAKREAAKKDINVAVETLNQAFEIASYHLEFKVNEAVNRVQVKVVDTATDKVIREIPPDKVLELAASVRDILNKAVGVIVDELG